MTPTPMLSRIKKVAFPILGCIAVLSVCGGLFYLSQKLAMTLLGFGVFLSQLYPTLFPAKKQELAVDPDLSRSWSIFMIATGFMLVVWGTFDHSPWQLDVLYFMALGRLVIAIKQSDANKRGRRGRETSILTLTESAKEQTR